MSRRAGRRGNKPPHIDVLELNRPKKEGEVLEAAVVDTPAEARKRVKLNVHATTSQVLSTSLDPVGQMEISVSEAVNINIFVRK